MKNSRIGYVAVLAIFMLCLCCGCRETPTIGEQIIVTAIGMEEQNESVYLSIQAVESLKTAGSLSEQTENATAVYHANGASVAQALQSFLNETGRSTYILHNQVIAMGLSSYADKSIFDSLDYFIRNLEGRSLVNLVMCRHNPSALLGIQSGNDAIPAEYVSQLLKEGVRWGIAVSSQLLDVQRSSSEMYDIGIPILTVEEGTPRLDGTAIFRNGYLAGELTEKQTIGLLFAANDIQQCLYTVNDLTFRLSDVRTSLTIQPDDDRFIYAFHIDGTADIVETAGGGQIMEWQKEQEINRLEQQLCTDTQEVVQHTTVTLASDVLALARRTAKDHRLSQEEAKTRLANATFTVTADVRVTESGFLS